MSHLFLSDVHIGAFEDDIEKVLQRDLIKLINYSAARDMQIHILGDLFDYWMEYPSWKPPLGRDVLDVLKEYSQSIAPVNFITGNHDNWTSGYFEDLGFSVTSEFLDLDIKNERFFLHHGDGLKDSSYNLPRPLMHRILRNKMFVKLYQSLLPPKSGIRLMKAFSDYSKQRAYCDPSILDKWAEQFLAASDYDYILCGHDHQPRVINFEHGTYLNLGTFFENRTVAVHNNGTLDLVVWDAAHNTLYPFEHRYKKAVSI
jgi:UDP-2,3-diacylglucosamine pyrophosphatase LpxH